MKQTPAQIASTLPDFKTEFCIHDLILLMQIWSLPNPFVGVVHKDSGGTAGSLTKLQNYLLIEAAEDDGNWHITKRGEIFLDHIEHTPLPQQVWSYDK